MTVTLTSNNLKQIGFVELTDAAGVIHYERNGLKVFFRESHGMDYLSGNPSLPFDELSEEITNRFPQLYGKLILPMRWSIIIPTKRIFSFSNLLQCEG